MLSSTDGTYQPSFVVLLLNTRREQAPTLSALLAVLKQAAYPSCEDLHEDRERRMTRSVVRSHRERFQGSALHHLASTTSAGTAVAIFGRIAACIEVRTADRLAEPPVAPRSASNCQRRRGLDVPAQIPLRGGGTSQPGEVEQWRAARRRVLVLL